MNNYIMNIQNISDESILNLILICRLCGIASDSYINIFGKNGIKYSINEKIFTHLKVKISSSDLLPKIICDKCFHKLDEFHHFFLISKKVQILLKNTITESLFSVKIKIELPVNKTCNSEKISTENNYKIYLCNDKKENTEIEKCITYNKNLYSVIDKSKNNKKKSKNTEVLLTNHQNVLKNNKIKYDKILRNNSVSYNGNSCKYKKNQDFINIEKKSIENSFLKLEQHNYKNVLNLSYTDVDCIFPMRSKLIELTKNSFDSIYRGDYSILQNNCIEYKKVDLMTIDKRAYIGNCDEKSEKSSKSKYNLMKLPMQLQCSLCTHVFTCAKELIKHYIYQHNNSIKTFKCTVCGKIFKVLKNFYKHYKKHNSVNKHICEVCGKSFTRNWTLRIHASVHSDAKPFNCDTCTKTFKNLCSLKNHKKSHLPDECKFIYTCAFCGKSFKSKFILTTHERIHTGQKDFICNICSKSFSSKSSLLSHILIHNNNQKVYCPLCNKPFRTEKLLKSHLQFHSCKKKLKCEYCAKEFHYSNQLNEHIRLHTGELPFKCEYCQKRFRLNSTLTIHRRQHTGVKPYKCKECNHSFTNWPNYNKHMKRKHYNTIIKENNDELILLKI